MAAVKSIISPEMYYQTWFFKISHHNHSFSMQLHFNARLSIYKCCNVIFTTESKMAARK